MLSELTDRELSRTVWGFATSGCVSEGFMIAAEELLIARQGMSLELLVTIVWALYKADRYSAVLLERLVMAVTGRINTLSAQNLSELAWILCRPGSSHDSALVDELAAAIGVNLEVFNSQQLTDVATAFAPLGMPELMQKIGERTAREVQTFKPVEVCRMAAGLALCESVRGSSVFGEVMAALRGVLDENSLGPGEIVMVCKTTLTLLRDPALGTLPLKLLSSATRKLDDFAPRSLVQLVLMLPLLSHSLDACFVKLAGYIDSKFVILDADTLSTLLVTLVSHTQQGQHVALLTKAVESLQSKISSLGIGAACRLAFLIAQLGQWDAETVMHLKSHVEEHLTGMGMDVAAAALEACLSLGWNTTAGRLIAHIVSLNFGCADDIEAWQWISLLKALTNASQDVVCTPLWDVACARLLDRLPLLSAWMLLEACAAMLPALAHDSQHARHIFSILQPQLADLPARQLIALTKATLTHHPLILSASLDHLSPKLDSLTASELLSLGAVVAQLGYAGHVMLAQLAQILEKKTVNLKPMELIQGVRVFTAGTGSACTMIQLLSAAAAKRLDAFTCMQLVELAEHMPAHDSSTGTCLTRITDNVQKRLASFTGSELCRLVVVLAKCNTQNTALLRQLAGRLEAISKSTSLEAMAAATHAMGCLAHKSLTLSQAAAARAQAELETASVSVLAQLALGLSLQAVNPSFVTQLLTVCQPRLSDSPVTAVVHFVHAAAISDAGSTCVAAAVAAVISRLDLLEPGELALLVWAVARADEAREQVLMALALECERQMFGFSTLDIQSVLWALNQKWLDLFGRETLVCKTMVALRDRLLKHRARQENRTIR